MSRELPRNRTWAAFMRASATAIRAVIEHVMVDLPSPIVSEIVRACFGRHPMGRDIQLPRGLRRGGRGDQNKDRQRDDTACQMRPRSRPRCFDLELEVDEGVGWSITGDRDEDEDPRQHRFVRTAAAR